MKSHKGYLIGPRLDVVDIFDLLAFVGFSGRAHLVAGAVVLSESNGFTRARCENYEDGKLVGVDFGLAQINYPVGREPDKIYDPIFNLAQMFAMWKRRGFQPWFGYTDDIALNPSMRGKYVQRATWGYMNYWRRQYGMKGVPSPYITLGKRRLTWWLEHPELKS